MINLYYILDKFIKYKMVDKIPNLDQIPNILGYMVLEEDQIITVNFFQNTYWNKNKEK